MLFVCVTLAGCSSLNRDSLKTYVPEVVQGNFVSKEQRQALGLGMDRAQVKDILGTPLVTSLFHADRWDYAFSIRRQGVAPQHFQVTVHFKDNVLTAIDNGDLPSEAEFAQRLVAQSQNNALPRLQASPEELNSFPAKKAPVGDNSQPALPSNYPPLEPVSR